MNERREEEKINRKILEMDDCSLYRSSQHKQQTGWTVSSCVDGLKVLALVLNWL